MTNDQHDQNHQPDATAAALEDQPVVTQDHHVVDPEAAPATGYVNDPWPAATEAAARVDEDQAAPVHEGRHAAPVPPTAAPNVDEVDDPNIPTPDPAQDDLTEPDAGAGVCGYPVDRTGDDWPGERSVVHQEGDK